MIHVFESSVRFKRIHEFIHKPIKSVFTGLQNLECAIRAIFLRETHSVVVGKIVLGLKLVGTK